MSLIELRIPIILLTMYLFLLLWTVLVSLLPDHNNGNSKGNEQVSAIFPDSAPISKQKHRQKRWVQINESDHLEEFDLSHNHNQD